MAFYEKQLAEMQKQDAWSDALEKKLTEQQKAFEHQQSSHYAKVYFNGLVDNLQVNVLDFSSATLTRKDLDLPVLRFDKNSLQPTVQALPMPVTVYDDGAASWLKGASLTEEQLKNSVTISQSVEDASAAHIAFDHPFTFNDDLIGSERTSSESPVTFFTADEKGERGEPIELPTEAFELNPTRGTLTYDLNLFPEDPAFVVGSIPLFLATIEKGEIDVAKLPKGLSLKDNALIVDQKEFPADSWRFYAKDASGNYLKEILGSATVPRSTARRCLTCTTSTASRHPWKATSAPTWAPCNTALKSSWTSPRANKRRLSGQLFVPRVELAQIGLQMQAPDLRVARQLITA